MARGTAYGPAGTYERSGSPYTSARPGTTVAAPRTGRFARVDGAWPGVPERIAFALAGWLPPALAIGYGGAAVSGCERAAVSCPGFLEPLQGVVIAALLLALMLRPRIGYLAAMGGAGLAVGAGLVAVTYSVLGVAQPLPEPLAVLTLALWVGSYALGAFAASRDWPLPRPWLSRASTRSLGGGPSRLGVR